MEKRPASDCKKTLIELTMEEGEEESNAELNEEADKFVKELESLKLASLLTGEYDSSNAILTFHAGAGGTEAQDWAEMAIRTIWRLRFWRRPGLRSRNCQRKTPVRKRI